MNRKSKIIPFSILTMLLVVGSGVLSSCSGPSTSGTSTTTTTTTTTSDSTSTSSSTTTTTTTTIPVVEVTSVTLSDAEVSLEVESTKQLTVVVLPATATVKDVTWTSSNIKFATVSTSGLVTAVAEGTATITATSGTCSDTCVVTVKKKVIPVTSVTLSEKAIHVEEKLTHKLTATIAPTTATIQTVDWSSSATNFATVDATGLVTAVAPGESTITAKAGDKTDTCKVTVTAAPIAVTSVVVTPATATLEVEVTQQLTVVVLPATATVKDVTWTSNKDTVATVSTTGLVTAISEGTATITATSGDFSDTCVVTVKPKVIPVDSVKVTPATATLEVDAKKQLSVEVLPANATDRKVTWTSSNSDFATVVDGLVTAIAKGEATITATAGAFSSTCVVTVKPKVIPVESITVEPTSVSIEEKQTQQLTATVLPTAATDPTVTWTSSRPTVATVDAAGLVTALIPGDTIITAKAGDITATCAVTVTAAPIPVDSVTITPASVTIEASHTEQLAATVLPATATDPTVAWTTNNAEVATVDSNGLVTAKAQGSAIITATAGSKTANCAVTVTPQIFPVTSVEVTPATATLIEKDTTTLTAVVLPFNATNKKVTWTSSDNNIATVSTTGVVTAVAPGTATITAKAESYSDTCVVTVNKRIIAVESVAINPTSIDLVEQNTTTLTATISPSNATDKSIAWSSDQTNIATVSAEGLVTANAPGTAIITATTNDGRKTATCTVNVTARIILVTGVEVTPATATIIEGETSTLTAKISPDNATTQTIAWTSSDNNVAIVSTTGVVTAVAPGTATITATSGACSDTCVVTVNKRIIHVDSVTVDPTSVSLEELGTKKLTATISPIDATDKSIAWSSDHSEIATVDQNGNVAAVNAGTAIITATTTDGNKTATCTVTVTAPTAGAIAVTGAKELYATGENMIVSLGVSMSNGTTVNYANVNLTTGENKPANATISGFNTATDGKKSGTIKIGSQTSTINYVVYKAVDSEVSLRGLVESSTENAPVVIGLTNDITVNKFNVTRPFILYGITSQANQEITISEVKNVSSSEWLFKFDGSVQKSLVASTIEFHNITLNDDAAASYNDCLWFKECGAIKVLCQNTKITLDTARGATYPITISAGNDHSTFDIIDSTLSGWCALNIWSSNMTINVKNSTLIGTSKFSGSSDDYSVIIVNTPDYRPIENNVINIKDSTINAIGNGLAPQYCIDLRTTNAIVNFSGYNSLSFTKGNAANPTPCYLKGEKGNQFNGLDTVITPDTSPLTTFMTNSQCGGL